MTVVTDPMTPPQAIATAQRMRDAGWTPQQIRDYLASRGVVRHIETVRRWSDAVRLERERENRRVSMNRKRAAASAASLPRQWQRYSAEFKLVRLRALVEQATLSHSAAARVMELDFGDVLTRNQVYMALKNGRYPKKVGA